MRQHTDGKSNVSAREGVSVADAEGFQVTVLFYFFRDEQIVISLIHKEKFFHR